jgi:hypothetical protein
MASEIRFLPAALIPLRPFLENLAAEGFPEILLACDRFPPIPSRAAMARLRLSRSFFSSDRICPKFISLPLRFSAIPWQSAGVPTRSGWRPYHRMSRSHLVLDIASVYLVNDMADPKLSHDENVTSRGLALQRDGFRMPTVLDEHFPQKFSSNTDIAKGALCPKKLIRSIRSYTVP